MSRYSVISATEKKRKKRKWARRSVFVFVLIILLSLLLALFFYRRSMNPMILDIAQTRLKSETTLAVNEAVCTVLENADFSELVTLVKNDENDIVLISSNSALVNSLARETAIISQKRINSLQSFDVLIPWGTLSGIPLLSEKGQTVSVSVSPIGNVSCNFTSVFESAGINQTLHRIYINVCSKVDLIMPTSHAEVTTETPVLICESLIIGKVPDTYLQGGLILGSS